MSFNICQQYNLTKLKVGIIKNNKPSEPRSEYGYDNIINEYRNKIDSIKNEDWKKVRWYINDFDFLVKDPIINRAFYKYWEIINEFDIFENYSDTDYILHCAEAPGGFIQGSNIFLQTERMPNEIIPQPKIKVDEDGFISINKKKKPKTQYKIYTISLNKDLPKYKSYNLPSYNKDIINKHVCVTYGKDNTGDINNINNVLYLKNLVSDKFFLITADGGFDEGTDFNNKEQLHYSLILSEIYTAIELQKADGHFILKMFDIFTDTSIHLLYLLSLCYETVHIYKPKTSRPTNSEKYIICKNFRLDESFKKHLIPNLTDLIQTLKLTKTKYTYFTLFTEIPQDFIDKIKNANSTLLNKQCDFLKNAINLCNDQEFLNTYDNMLSKSLEDRRQIFHEWEEMYNLKSYI